MQSLTKSETECPWLAQLKPWNGLGTYVDFLANHYALIAMNPKTIDIARHRTKQLKSDFPTLGILIVQRLKVLNEPSNNIYS
jgi:hypothetical protein